MIKIKNLIFSIHQKMANHSTLKKGMLLVLDVLFAGYVFSTVAFSGREHLNYLTYGVISLFAILLILYVLFFGSFSFDYRYLFLIGFLIITYISTVIGTRLFETNFTITLVLLSAIIFSCYYQQRDNSFLIINLFIIGSIAFSLYYCWVYKNELIHLNFQRLGGYFANENEIGTYFACAASFSLGVALLKKKKWFYIIPAILLTALALTTGSKKSLIIVAVALIVFLFIRFKNNKDTLLIVFMAALVVFFVILNLPIMSGYKYRFSTFFSSLLGNGAYDNSTIQRYQFLGSGINIGMKNILFGIGSNGFATITGFGLYSHAMLSEILCNYGMIALILFYAPYFLVLSNLDDKDELKAGLAVAIIAFFMVFTVTAIVFYSKTYYLLLSIAFYLTKNKTTRDKKITLKELLFRNFETNPIVNKSAHKEETK